MNKTLLLLGLIVSIFFNSCDKEERKNIVRINPKYPKGWKMEYRSHKEAPEVRSCWNKSEYFIDNQTSKTLYLDEIRYLEEHEHFKQMFEPKKNPKPLRTIKIKPGVNYQLPKVVGMGSIDILHEPSKTVRISKNSKQTSRWYLHY